MKENKLFIITDLNVHNGNIIMYGRYEGSPEVIRETFDGDLGKIYDMEQKSQIRFENGCNDYKWDCIYSLLKNESKNKIFNEYHIREKFIYYGNIFPEKNDDKFIITAYNKKTPIKKILYINNNINLSQNKTKAYIMNMYEAKYRLNQLIEKYLYINKNIVFELKEIK